jgi:hypothetical protein
LSGTSAASGPSERGQIVSANYQSPGERIKDQSSTKFLMLNAGAEDRKRIRRDHTNQFDLSPNGKNKFDGLSNEVIEIEAFQFKGCFFQQTAHPPDDFTGAPVVS